MGCGLLVERDEDAKDGRIEVLVAALKMAFRLFGKDEADPVRRNMVRGHIATVLAEERNR